MTEEQIAYVADLLQAGTDEHTVRQNLVGAGYQETLIAQLLQAAHNRLNPTPPPAAVPRPDAVPVAAASTGPTPGVPPTPNTFTAAPTAAVVGSVDSNRKLFGILGYIFTFLFFLPLVSEDSKNDAFSRFHAGQQLNLLLFGFSGYIALIFLSVIPLIGLLTLLLWPALAVCSLVFLVMGVINVINDEMKPLPLIGGFRLIK